MVKHSDAVAAAKTIIEYLASLGAEFDDEALENTPRRMIDALREIVTQEHDIELRHFSSNVDNLVIVSNISATSLCPHHVLPVLYKVSIGYIARGKVLGLSKLPRMARRLAGKCYLQEEYTTRLAEEVEKETSALGVGVLVKGLHMCMYARGVKTESHVITSAFRGVMLASVAAREEFLSLVSSQKCS